MFQNPAERTACTDCSEGILSHRGNVAVDGVAASAALSSTARFDAFPAQGESDGDEVGSRAIPCSMVRIALPDDLLAGMSVNASVVEQQNGIDLEEARLLLTEARAAILQVRAALV